jgi:uncharacterized membrane protein
VFEIASLKEGMMHGVELFQLLLEIISIACVVIGLGKTLWLAARVRDHEPGFPRIRLCFGSWLILALEFQLAADILATTVAPSKEELVRLAIIAVIRTFLNYFLGKELDAQAERQQPSLSGHLPAPTPDEWAEWHKATTRKKGTCLIP